MNLWLCFLLGVVGSFSAIHVSAQRQPCPALTLKNGRVRMRGGGRMVYFRCKKKFKRVGHKLAVCLSSGTWSQQTPVCVGRGCPDLGALDHVTVEELYKGGILRFTCPQGMRREGPQTLMCDGQEWDHPPPTCLYGISMGCDFEDSGLCGWSQDTEDDFDWTWTTGRTPTSETGPMADHTTGSGHYIFMESSAPQKYGHVTRLISPPYQPPPEPMCVEFFYHMQGPEKELEVGDLDVLLRSEGLGDMVLFHKHGYQGDGWIRGVAPVPAQDSVFRIVFAATRRQGWSGDIALDDIRVFNCSDMPENITSTTFSTTTTTTPTTTTSTTTTTTPKKPTIPPKTSSPMMTPSTTTTTTTMKPTTLTTTTTTTPTTTTSTTPTTTTTTTTTTTPSTTSPSSSPSSSTASTTSVTSRSPTQSSSMPEKSTSPLLPSVTMTSSTISGHRDSSTKSSATSTTTSEAKPESSSPSSSSSSTSSSSSSSPSSSSSSSSTSLSTFSSSPATPSHGMTTKSHHRDATKFSTTTTTATPTPTTTDAIDNSDNNNNSSASNSSVDWPSLRHNATTNTSDAEGEEKENGSGSGSAEAGTRSSSDSSAGSISEYLPLIVGVASGLVVGLALVGVLAWLWKRNKRKQKELQIEEDQLDIIGSIDGASYSYPPSGSEH